MVTSPAGMPTVEDLGNLNGQNWQVYIDDFEKARDVWASDATPENHKHMMEELSSWFYSMVWCYEAGSEEPGSEDVLGIMYVFEAAMDSIINIK